MSSAWIGLIGVGVGGVISTLWQWLAAVRQELSDAVVAARLVHEDLSERLSQAATAKPESAQAREKFGAGAESPRTVPTELPNSKAWMENRAPLARVLGHKQWIAVADAYRVPTAQSADAAASPKTRIEEALKEIAPYAKSKRSMVWRRLPNAFERD